MSATDQPAPSPAEPTMGGVARLGGALFSPRRTFADIARHPTWFLPLFLWTAFSVAVAVRVAGRVSSEELVRGNLQRFHLPMTEQNINQQVTRAEQLRGPVAVVSGLVAPSLACLFVAVLLWLSWKGFGSGARFSQFFGVTAHAFLPVALSYVLLLPAVISERKLDVRTLGTAVKSNLGFLVDPARRPALATLLQSLDVFSLWSLGLLVVGTAAATGSRKSRVTAYLLLLWLAFIAVRVAVVALRTRAA